MLLRFRFQIFVLKPRYEYLEYIFIFDWCEKVWVLFSGDFMLHSFFFKNCDTKIDQKVLKHVWSIYIAHLIKQLDFK